MGQSTEEEIVIPVLTERQKEFIVLQYREEQRAKRMALAAQEALAGDKPEEAKAKKLYLITFAGHFIALPGENGKAVHHTCVYALIERSEKERGFYGGNVEVVAEGDGRWLKTPLNVILHGHTITAMVEVSPELLQIQ